MSNMPKKGASVTVQLIKAEYNFGEIFKNYYYRALAENYHTESGKNIDEFGWKLSMRKFKYSFKVHSANKNLKKENNLCDYKTFF